MSAWKGGCLRWACALVLLLAAGRAHAQDSSEAPPPTDAPAPEHQGDSEAAQAADDARDAASADASSDDASGASQRLGSPEATSDEELPSAVFAASAPVVASELAAPSPDLVEERELVSSTPRTLLGRQAAIWLEGGITAGGPADARAIALSPELGVRYRVTDDLVAEASWGLTYASTDVSGEATIGGMAMPFAATIERLDPGNPTLGGAFVHRDAGYLLEVGLAMAIPTGSRADPGGDVAGAAQRASSELSRRAAMSMRGYRGAWRWAPERFSLAIPFRVAIPLAPITIEIDGALATMFPVLGDRGVDVDTLVDLGVGVGATVVGPLALGARIGGVGAATGSMVPPFTLALEPWARLRFDPVQITARGVLNLSGDDGLGGSRGPSFGVLVGAGVEL